MFAAHPETQKMFPRFANVPVAELSGNKYFQQQVYNCLFGLTVIIKHMDYTELGPALMKDFASPSFYVDGPSAAAQLDETTRLFNEAMAEELGAVYTPEAKAAFTELLNLVHGILAKSNEDGAPTAQDKQIIRDNINILKAQKSNYGAKTMLK
jgi:Globin